MKLLSFGQKEPIKELVQEFNNETYNGNDMQYTYLEKAVFDIQGRVEEKGIDALFTLGNPNFI